MWCATKTFFEGAFKAKRTELRRHKLLPKRVEKNPQASSLLSK
jgi:hypothetical protein